MHIVDDYYLQGWLASAKQKSWWAVNCPQDKYKYDYLRALLMHSISWSFMIMIPSMFFVNFDIGWLFVLTFIINVCVHFVTDNQKANAKTINLWQDQTIHFIQIIFTVFILYK